MAIAMLIKLYPAKEVATTPRERLLRDTTKPKQSPSVFVQVIDDHIHQLQR